jgi:NAD(P)-dependent dehydrogenase (short-subunit alcohol dehydrogenase family)
VELADKVCLIAGASGAIGAAVAERFRNEGAHLALTYLSKRPDEGMQSQNRNQGRVLEFPLDISRWEQVQAVVRQVVDAFGTIHGLINCTGVIGPIGPTASVPMDEWVRAVETNLMGSFYLTRAVLPTMLSGSSGKIIHFSGGGAAYGRPFHTAYSASKAALVRFTESLAEELRENHIDVNAIAPGPVRSRMWDQMRKAGAAGGERNLAELQKMEETGGVPPERAATLAVFLASERSNGLTGRLISAVYDNWGVLDRRIPDVMNSDAGTLRRVPLD